MSRKPMDGASSRKLFTRTAQKVSSKNYRPPAARGGYRL